MARGVRATLSAAPAPPELPKVSFQKIDDELTSPTTGVDDRQARSYGYNDFSDFQRPEHYIRHIEPLESELARQVEYDMDEQDKEWLDNLNAERRKEQVDKISYEVFEIIMDRLEKEWFDLTKNIPKPDFAMPSEDSTCAICDDSEGENSNAIVFCDGCNLAVHQDCYGVPYIPEGQWLCRKCTVSPENPVSCILCPNEGGAFKQTINGEWVHLLCAMWVPETRVANETFMEPVVGIEDISKQRWKLKCSICDIRGGACIQCAKTSCFLAFHTTCARKEKLLLPMKSTQAETVTLTCYCDKHLPKEQQEIREAALAAQEEEEEDESHPSKLSKSARAYAKTYKPGPPLVPAIIVDRITQYIAKINVRKRGDFLLMVCKYWSLKREARRGAPLLKRLHLEPWTASSNSKLQSEEERAMKLEELRHLERDLLKLRELSALTWKRESRKLQQVEILQGVLTQAIYPHEPRLRLAFERIVGYDKHDYFKNPVNRAEVPDYFDIVARPMSWSVIDAKLDRHEYWDIKDFRDDIELVLNNAMLYNNAGTPFHKAAQRIHNASQPILLELENLSMKPKTAPPLVTENPQPLDETEETAVKIENTTSSLPALLPLVSGVGDLEPPLELVELLLSLDAIRDESELILNADPITSLLNFELPVFKPPPEPKPRKAPKLKLPKPTRDRSEEYKRQRAKKAEERAQERAAKAEIEAAIAASGITSEKLIIRTRRSATHVPAGTSSESSSPVPQTSEADSILETLPPEYGTSYSMSSSGLFSTAVAGPSRSRIPLDTPSVPEFREDVDNQASFKLFNSGWILPSDQKRRTRTSLPPPPTAVPDHSSLPPPKKKIKLDRGTSKLSVFSTAEEENETLKQNESSGSSSAFFDAGRSSAPRSTRSEAGGLRALSAAAAAAAVTDSPMDVDAPYSPSAPPIDLPNEQSTANAEPLYHDVVPTDSPAVPTENNERLIEPRSGLPRIGNIIHAPNGKIIIEELDSPATRRQKNMRKKAEREKIKLAAGEPATTTISNSDSLSASLSAASVSAPLDVVLSPPPELAMESQSSGTVQGKVKENYEEEELGELRVAEEVAGRDAEPLPLSEPSASVGTKARKSAATTSKNPAVEAKKSLSEFKPGQKLEGGTLVWAKADTYPWWPAVIFEIEDMMVPKSAKKMYENMKKKNKNVNLHFVRFYDKQHSWQCLALERLLPLGEDDELDADLVASQSKRQKWKSGRVKAECREAWRKAKQEMDTPAEDGDNL
ncbi:hypothetical protein GYMLUDRAFT_47090 [Collybiopsis luxurians FD-317 M1]|uniref:Uncharacterized protein n=1 Tax=Collybiopsis luxurians FD-317 M1 TaxID=944289 RepID=A0A0D0CE36_9AGAR|nr:hypothetical protein GYMLUDRAFT_47090 [Collybiopsis luxurians FD-317 M1]